MRSPRSESFLARSAGVKARLLAAAALALNLHVALAFAPGSYELPVWFKQSFLLIDEDIAEASAKDKRVILFFGQNGCPYCKKLIEVNLSDADIASFAQRHFAIIALNVFGAREVVWVDGAVRTEKDLASHLDIRATPSLVFLDKHGNIVERLTGYEPPADFKATLERASAR